LKNRKGVEMFVLQGLVVRSVTGALSYFCGIPLLGAILLGLFGGTLWAFIQWFWDYKGA